MQENSNNPLAKYFRQPAIHLTLPSKGQYWPLGSLELNMSGQLEVYPMTTRDEITIRTPDALLNGQSIVSIFQSCCPQIKDAWKCPKIDIDAILIAIRIASYGANMDIDTICPNPECKNDNKHSLDLTAVLDGLRSPNYNKIIEINGVGIKLKPNSYFDSNKANQITFEEQRLLLAVQNDEVDDENKVKVFKDHLDKVVSLNLELMASATEYIEIDSGQKVVDPEHIFEFYNQVDGKVTKLVRENLELLAKEIELPKPRMACEECSTAYPVEVGFDYANFFDPAS